MKESNNIENEIIISTSSKTEINSGVLEELKEQFSIIELINKSNISKIYKALNIEEDNTVLLKVIEKKNLLNDYAFFNEQIKREEEILRLCRSNNIINIYQKIETKNLIVFELEYCGKDLATYIKEKGPLKYHKFIFKDILIGISKAIEVLNKNGIMHRDIKPSNIFFDETLNKVKLGGFGCSIYIKENTSEPLGSILYTAPEIIKKLKYDEKCDLWSLGVTLYEIYFGELPYGKIVSVNHIKDIIYHEQNIYSKKASIPEFNELFTKLLTVNRYNRMKFTEFFNLVDKIEEIFIQYELDCGFEKENHTWQIGDDFTYKYKQKLMEMNEKIKMKEKYLNSILFECTDDKNEDLLVDEDEKIVNKIMNILEEGKLPDIMNLPNGITELNKKSKFNNIIYYDENIDFINSLHRDSDYFEKITSGAFILCRNIDSLNLVKEEIIKLNKPIKKENSLKKLNEEEGIIQNQLDKTFEFNLIVTGSKCEKIMTYLKQNKEFEKCIKNICIYCMHPEKYQYLKTKYPKIHDDIYKTRKDVVNFIDKYANENINSFPLTKLITYEEYVEKYKERHIKISEFYGNLNPITYQKQISDIKTLIRTEAINGELIQKNEDKLIKGFLTFDINKDLKNLENDENLDNLNEITITEYTRNSIYKDLNKWLLNSKFNYESIAYFTARLMYHLNSYAQQKQKFFNKNNKVLYRGIKMKYSCLLQYERAERKIIILTSFTSTSENETKAIKFSGKKDQKELYKTNLLFSVLFTIKNKWEKDWIPSGIVIQNISAYKEKEVLFQPFSFFYVEKVNINLSKYTADIYLESIGKNEIFEENLKEGKELFYDGTENIIRFRNK